MPQMTRRAVLSSSAATLTLAAMPATASAAPKISNADLWAEAQLAQITDAILDAYPESASSAGVATGRRAKLGARLTDRSAEGQEGIAGDVKATLAALKAIDTQALEPARALDIDVVRTVCELADEGFAFGFGDVPLLNSNWSYRNAPYAVAQNTGAFVEIPSFLDASHPVRSRRDADAYLERMEAYAAQLDGETGRILADAQRGVVLPDFLMQKTLGQLRGAQTTKVAEWGIVQSLAKRAGTLKGDYAAAALRIAETKIAPALARQIAALEAIAPAATPDAGVWKFADGEAYYAWALRAGTTTNMSPAEVHETGLEELRALQAQMDPILRSIGYTEGSVGARMTALGADPRYQFADGDAGRAEILAFIDETLAEIRTLMPQAFETLVPGFLEVTRIAPDVEAGAPGAYGGAGTIDGKEPGHYWINLRTPALHNRFSLADLTYHEAIPGHVWQGEYTFRQSLLRSLLAFNAYSEGWALYAQQIADELGVYADFPVGRLGYLQSLAFRACRLVVDTGLHAKRWTREQAIEWFVANNGSSPEEVRGEVDRYCAWPGQACGYKIGHSAINTLRARAQGELGTAYDFRRFNDAVVLGGNVPMTVLGRVIDGYIERDRPRT